MPEKKIKTTPKDFFLHLGSIIALYSASISLINLLFDVINASFPDVLNYSPDAFSSSIRLAIATLIILFPTYLILSHFLSREIESNPEKKNLSVRKWLIYLTLFISGIVVATDLVVLINTFLSGEITLRFILKIVAVLIVAAITFGYYFYDLKNVWREKRKSLKIFAAAVSVFVLASIVSSFVIVGSPKTQRMMRLDTQRINDLQNIQWQIINYWQQKEMLPSALSDLKDPLSGFVLPQDPEGKTYQYEKTNKLSFTLCAEFDLDSIAQSSVKPLSVPMDYQSENWLHDKGIVCFDRTIDPEKYPPFRKQ